MTKPKQPPRTCAGCPNPARNQRTICAACEGELSRRLLDQPSLYEALLAKYTKQTHEVEQVRRSGSPTWPLPFVERAGWLIYDQARFLAAWSGHVRHLSGPHPDGPTCPRVCGHRSCSAIRRGHSILPSVALRSFYVDAGIPLLRSRPEIAEMLERLRAFGRSCIIAVDTPEVRTRVHAGPCPKVWPNGDGVDEACPGQVDAIFPADEREDCFMKCSACRAEWPSIQWASTGDKILARKKAIDAPKPKETTAA